jgi:hypothetical protein
MVFFDTRANQPGVSFSLLNAMLGTDWSTARHTTVQVRTHSASDFHPHKSCRVRVHVPCAEQSPGAWHTATGAEHSPGAWHTAAHRNCTPCAIPVHGMHSLYLVHEDTQTARTMHCTCTQTMQTLCPVLNQLDAHLLHLCDVAGLLQGCTSSWLKRMPSLRWGEGYVQCALR